jgi:hypothetical protein
VSTPFLPHGRPMAVANEDGSPISGGGGAGGGLTDAELRAAPVEVEIANGGSSTGGLTDAELRAAPVPVDTELVLPAALDADGGLKVHVQNPGSGSGGGLTDTELRATPVPVSGPLTDTQLRNSAVPVSLASVPSHAVTGPLTDTQLRATPVPVAQSGDVSLSAATLAALETIQVGSLPNVALDTATLAALETIQIGSMPAVALDAATLAALETISIANFPATQPVSGTVGISGTVPVSGPLTDTQLRASAVPVSLASAPTTAVTGPLTDTQLRASAVPVTPSDRRVQGELAADAAIGATFPLLVGGRARTAVPTAMSADDDAVHAWYDRRGAQIVREREKMGRTRLIIKYHAATTATADTLLNCQSQRNGVDAAAVASQAVTAGKIMVLERCYVGIRTAPAARGHDRHAAATPPARPRRHRLAELAPDPRRRHRGRDRRLDGQRRRPRRVRADRHRADRRERAVPGHRQHPVHHPRGVRV